LASKINSVEAGTLWLKIKITDAQQFNNLSNQKTKE